MDLMKKLVTLATVGAFVLSLQGASLAQTKEDKGPAGAAPPAVETQTPQPGAAETTKPEEKKTTKKKATTKKKTTKKKTKPKKKATPEEG
jgi:hypothetical protein